MAGCWAKSQNDEKAIDVLVRVEYNPYSRTIILEEEQMNLCREFIRFSVGYQNF